APTPRCTPAIPRSRPPRRLHSPRRRPRPLRIGALMHALTVDAIRASFVNVTLRGRKQIVPPDDLGSLPWQDLDYLGWRDPKNPLLAYVVVELADGPVGVLLRQAERAPRSRAQCSWCEDTQLPNDVMFF